MAEERYLSALGTLLSIMAPPQAVRRPNSHARNVMTQPTLGAKCFDVGAGL